MRSYILIARRDLYTIFYIIYDLYLFDYRHDYSEERVDPGRRIKILENL